MKKGYTIIELLITIVIVAIMLSIFIPSIIIMYNKIMISSSNNIKEEIFSKSNDYLIDHEKSITYQKTNEYLFTCLTISDLEIEKSLIDPKTNVDYTKQYVKITKTNENIIKKEIVENELSCYDPTLVALVPNVKETFEVNKDLLLSSKVKAFYQNKDISDDIQIINKTNNQLLEINQKFTEIGEFDIEFKLTISDEQIEIVTKKINVVDTTSPTVKIIGGNELILNLNDPYIEQGIEISDNYYPYTITVENLLNDDYQVDITSNLDINKEGEYQVKYQVTDQHQNKTTVIKKIIVNNLNIVEYSYSKKNCQDVHETITYDNWVDCELEDGSWSKCNKQYNEIKTKNICDYSDYSPWSSIEVTADENTKVRTRKCLLDEQDEIITSSCVIIET